jgi:hypothetical protein
VVASAPATGPVGTIAGAVFNAPIYSFHDIACSPVAFFILGGAPACLGTNVSVLSVIAMMIAFDYFYSHGHHRVRCRLSVEEHASLPFVEGAHKACSITASSHQ